MGNFGEEPNKGIDLYVGGLVWVRRRNGSWWPGRILGPDELPEGCMPTPRSGTPVKLLGREDASVDWYNLEKSKRVKAFRCGEYDDFIEKAKASVSLPSKKAVKYARREDAILHALEIESACLGKDSADLSSEPKLEENQHHVDESPSSSLHDEVDSDLAPEVSHSGVSFEEPDYLAAIKEEPKRNRTPNDSEEEGFEGAKRMRGLKDLGIGVSSSSRRKGSQVGHVQEFLKRKNRKRPLAKVLECTAMVSVPVVCDQLSSPTGSSVPGASESKVSGLESNESKMNTSVAMNNNSDSTGVSCENAISLNTSGLADASSLGSKQKENEISSTVGGAHNRSSDRLFDVPLVAEKKHSADLSTVSAGPPQKAQVGAQSSQSSHVETISLGNEEHNETGSTSSGAPVHNISQRIEKGTSEWQLKGKRNSRSRKTDMDNEAETHVVGIERDSLIPTSNRSVDSNRVGGSLISRLVTDNYGEEFRGWSWNTSHKESQPRGSTAETGVPQRQVSYRQSRLVVNPKYDSSDFSLRLHADGSGLCDINVEVKSSYQPQRVPYISLMSKLRGGPIIGHPLQIEVLDVGFCDDILGFSECYSSSSEFDFNPSNQPVFLGDGKVYKRKPCGRPASKHHSKGKRNGVPSKKIRMLSSLTGAQQQVKKPVVEKLKGPAIACVPLNVVFSRIDAGLNGSIRPNASAGV